MREKYRIMIATGTIAIFVIAMLKVYWLNPLFQLNLIKDAFNYNTETGIIVLALFAIIDAPIIYFIKKFTYDIIFPKIRLETGGAKIQLATKIMKKDDRTIIIKTKLFPLFKTYPLDIKGCEIRENLWDIIIPGKNMIYKDGKMHITNAFDKFMPEDADSYNEDIEEDLKGIGDNVIMGVKGNFGLQYKKFEQGLPYQIIKSNRNDKDGR